MILKAGSMGLRFSISAILRYFPQTQIWVTLRSNSPALAGHDTRNWVFLMSYVLKLTWITASSITYSLE